jgi:hypothetical protein
MDLATRQLIKRLQDLGPEGRAKLDDEHLARIDTILAAEWHDGNDARCRREEASFEAGPLFWLTQLTKTENPQYEAQGLPFLAAFPSKSYFVPLFSEFLARHNVLFIPKSRTMMTSWAAVGFCTWAAQWKDEEAVIQTLNVDRAIHLIDYARQLVEHQAPWISERHPIDKRSVFTIRWKNGGEISAIPSGANAIRAFHPTTYVQDESAFMPEGEEALNSVTPTQAKIICISTAAPGWFGDMCSW